jgi:hypothetical protein
MDRQSDAKIFPLPGASEALGRKEATAACPTEVLSVWRARLTPRKEQGNEGQMPEVRGQSRRLEGGRRRAPRRCLEWLAAAPSLPAQPANGLHAKKPWRPLLPPPSSSNSRSSSSASFFTRQSRGADDPGDDVQRRHPDRFEPLNGCQLTNLGRDRQHRTICRRRRGVSSVFPVLRSFG